MLQWCVAMVLHRYYDGVAVVLHRYYIDRHCAPTTKDAYDAMDKRNKVRKEYCSNGSTAPTALLLQRPGLYAPTPYCSYAISLC
jgi:hypothetical protein